MAKDATDTSSISFTALYTGHVWYRNGLSAPAFHTSGGSVLYHALAPFEAVGKVVAGGNIRTFLLQRHHLIDHLVERAIRDEGVTQILEIACGLSPRGVRFRARHPDLTYMEADLPEMAARKERLLADNGLLDDRHRVVPINVFEQNGPLALETVLGELDADRPVLVITEGLVNYFPTDVISGVWSRLATALSAFPKGIYLTDNYPLYHDHPLRKTMRALGGMLGTVSRSRVSFHFGSDDEARDCFRKAGFGDMQIHDPADYYDETDMPRSRGTPFVRIIEARTKR